jgi:serine/threonine-protein kinase
MAPATERADVYAIGALTYLALSGRPPFSGERADAVFFQQLEGRYDPLTEVADVPAAFDPIVARALSLEPSERHPSVEAFRRELLAAHDSLQRTYLGTRVFVVDDDIDQMVHTSSLVREALPQATVLGYSDARGALREAEVDVPDIAVVDLEMPEINGVELTAAFKSHGESQRTHVVTVTGVGSARDWEVLQHLGVSGFLTKPVDEAELASLMRHLAVSDL